MKTFHFYKLKYLFQGFRCRTHPFLESLESLKNLSKNPDIVIQKSDKGNSVVILDKKVYLEKMKEMLNKNDQFLKLSMQEEKHYNFFD